MRCVSARGGIVRCSVCRFAMPPRKTRWPCGWDRFGAQWALPQGPSIGLTGRQTETTAMQKARYCSSSLRFGAFKPHYLSVVPCPSWITCISCLICSFIAHLRLWHEAARWPLATITFGRWTWGGTPTGPFRGGPKGGVWQFDRSYVVCTGWPGIRCWCEPSRPPTGAVGPGS